MQCLTWPFCYACLQNIVFPVDEEAMSFDECMELLAQTFPLVEASEVRLNRQQQTSLCVKINKKNGFKLNFSFNLINISLAKSNMLMHLLKQFPVLFFPDCLYWFGHLCTTHRKQSTPHGSRAATTPC